MHFPAGAFVRSPDMGAAETWPGAARSGRSTSADSKDAAQYTEKRSTAFFRPSPSVDPEETTVAGVALRWGFWHPGAFSVLYRETFGEKRSETLQRRR